MISGVPQIPLMQGTKLSMQREGLFYIPEIYFIEFVSSKTVIVLLHDQRLKDIIVL